ncbi:hypothetical protein CCR91_11990 [Thiorhodovibrio winogradskyi]|nr:hypothetical protein [Thiorhodovibrio winogradskyi]
MLVAALLMQACGRDTNALETRLVALEARLERLAIEVEALREPPSSAPNTPAATAPAVAGGREETVAWRFGPNLDGDPLRVAAETLDRARDRVELLLEIKAPLGAADAWPRQPGQPTPLVVIAKDNGGAVIAETPMTLLRGSRLEPGAYLHLGAQLPAQAGTRVNLIEVR